MSGGFVPSKSTVYVSNLPFDLSNNDLHKLFEKYGKIVKVTIVKERETRKSKGVAFILFLTREDAMKCVEETNLSQVFGRTLKASIAKDNGRCTEFIKRKEYPNKTRCYECGEFGHLSYNCSKNLLGERQPPPKKVKKKKKKESTGLSKEQIEYFDSSEDERCEDVASKSTKRLKKDDHDGAEEDEEDAVSDDETLSAAIAYEQERHELEQYRLKVATGNYDNDETRIGEPKRKKIKKSSYFSDEEESD